MVQAFVKRLLLCGILLLALPATAQEGVYQVRVPVADQSSEAREQALRQAMSRALVRATGEDGMDSAEAAQPLLDQASRFVQLYQYESTPEGLVLSVRFDAAGLRRALAGQNLSVWSADRPPVLVWLGGERGGERVLVGADEATGLRDQLVEAARERGVLLLFPLLDAEDRGKVGFSDVWGGFEQPVLTASRRYGTPLVLMGRMQRNAAGDWRVRWQLFTEQGSRSWLASAGGIEQALDESMAELARRLRQDYAEVPSAAGDRQRLRVRVEGVSGMEEYLRLRRRLQQARGVSTVQPLLLEPGSVAFELNLSADPRRALQALEADGMLVPLERPQPTAEAFGTPEYRYRLVL